MGMADNSGIKITSFAMQPPSSLLVPWDQEKLSIRLEECDKILFAAYRTSTKLKTLQESLKLNLLKLNVVENVFQQHGIGHCENNLILDLKEASTIIQDLYISTSKIRSNYYNPALDIAAYTNSAVELAVKIFGGSADLKRPKIIAKDLKVFLVVLCDGKLRDKFIYLFRQFAFKNGDHCLTKKSLADLLKTCVKIPEYFNESASFGSGFVEAAVDSCIKLNENQGWLFT